MSVVEVAKVSKETIEKLRKRRFIDAATASTMLAIGWRQVGTHEGLLWCPTCSQPTVWRNAAGVPSHLWCSDILESAT